MPASRRVEIEHAAALHQLRGEVDEGEPAILEAESLEASEIVDV